MIFSREGWGTVVIIWKWEKKTKHPIRKVMVV